MLDTKPITKKVIDKAANNREYRVANPTKPLVKRLRKNYSESSRVSYRLRGEEGSRSVRKGQFLVIIIRERLESVISLLGEQNLDLL